MLRFSLGHAGLELILPSLTANEILFFTEAYARKPSSRPAAEGSSVSPVPYSSCSSELSNSVFIDREIHQRRESFKPLGENLSAIWCGLARIGVDWRGTSQERRERTEEDSKNMREYVGISGNTWDEVG